MGEIYKPSTCNECPVVEVKKAIIVCGVSKNMQASKKDKYEQQLMYAKCPLEWDKK